MVPTTDVVGYFRPSLRDWFLFLMLPTTDLVGYFRPSLCSLRRDGT
jgi:hypothetical protein